MTYSLIELLHDLQKLVDEYNHHLDQSKSREDERDCDVS